MSMTLENQLFSWDSWDQMDIACFQFFNPQLVCSIGEFSVGTQFDWAVFDIEKSKLILCDYDGVEHIFDLKVTAVPRT